MDGDVELAARSREIFAKLLARPAQHRVVAGDDGAKPGAEPPQFGFERARIDGYRRFATRIGRAA